MAKQERTKAVSLLSGGIDSPVSTYIMLKQGLDITAVHFHNQTLESRAVENKVAKLAAQVASATNKPLTLYLIPFKELQMEMLQFIPPRYRMIVYKRVMLKIAEKIANKIDAKFLITGDSLGQVASQTLDNIAAIYTAVKLPILSPLLSFNKEEIMEIAREINTYETAILPYSDCCSFLIAKHPETKAKPDFLKKIESNMNLTGTITKAIKNAKILTF